MTTPHPNTPITGTPHVAGISDPLSRPPQFHVRPPVLNHPYSVTPPPRLPSHSSAVAYRALTGSPQPSSLQLPHPPYLNDEKGASSAGGTTPTSSGGSNSSSSIISRSISDSTLRRAALHLNLNNHQQSVLPSFTSLQQFKVGLCLFIAWITLHQMSLIESRYTRVVCLKLALQNMTDLWSVWLRASLLYFNNFYRKSSRYRHEEPHRVALLPEVIASPWSCKHRPSCPDVIRPVRTSCLHWIRPRCRPINLPWPMWRRPMGGDGPSPAYPHPDMEPHPEVPMSLWVPKDPLLHTRLLELGN